MKFHNWLPVLSRTSYRQGVVTAWDFRNSDNALEGTWKGCIVTYVFTLATTTISPVSIQSVGGAGGQLACLPLRSGTVSGTLVVSGTLSGGAWAARHELLAQSYSLRLRHRSIPSGDTTRYLFPPLQFHPVAPSAVAPLPPCVLT